MKKIRGIGIIGIVAMVLVAVAVAVGVPRQMVDRVPGGVSLLDSSDSLASEIASDGASVQASRFSDDSVAAFSDALHIVDADGNELSLDEVPADDYTGFLFKLSDAASGAGDVAVKISGIAESGLVQQVHGDLYRIDSLDVLADLLDADQVDFIEPDFNMHLQGDVEVDGSTAWETGISDEIHDQVSSEKQIDKLMQTPGVQQPNGGTEANPAPDWPVNDELADQLYHLGMLNVKGAWEAGLDGDPYYFNGKPLHADSEGNATPVKVAVIDTGLYGTGEGEQRHEDLDYDHMESGFDFIHDTDATTADAHGHGTFVSGLIAAQVGNGIGVAGLMPGVTIVSEKVFDTGSASTADVISGIYHAVDVDGVDVINMSLGGEYNERTLETACDYAVSQGVLVVASAGNDGVSTPNYPAAYDSVVGVASINSSNQRSSWSQYGKSVFVTAYGESVTSTFNEGAASYKTASGTSFSGPEVAALGAMCKSVYPDIDQQTFKDFLIQTSTDMGTPGFDDYFGYGRVDFAKMAEVVLASQLLPYYDVSFDVTGEDGKAVEGAQVKLVTAEDVTWDADPDEGIEAGRWSKGKEITAADSAWPEGKFPAEGAYRLHRGTYAYTITCDGKYTATGTFKTFTPNQTVSVSLQTAYETAISVVNGAGEALDRSSLEVVSSSGRTEATKARQGARSVFDLASGSYSYKAWADGYEDASGSFVVQRADKDIQIALYKAEELSSVTFDFVDADTSASVGGSPGIVVYDASGNTIDATDDGAYRLARNHVYSAVASKAGYEDARQEFTVGSEGSQIVTLRMTKAQFAITFDIIDQSANPVAGALVKVAAENGEVMQANAGNPYRYNLNNGNYSFMIEAEGYESEQGAFTVAMSSYTRTVQLSARSYSVSFSVADRDTGVAVEDYATKVSQSGMLRAIAANPDGTYSLTPGSYSYIVYKTGYEAASDDFEVRGSDVTIPVSLAPRTSTEIAYAGGSGTEADPYLIATEEQLRYLASQTEIVRMTRTDAETNQRGEVGGYYKLIDDIELHGEWMPIGNCEFSGSNYLAFTGTFDGAGHVVSGLEINSSYDYQGFFGYVYSAEIKNLTVEGVVRCDGKNATSGASYVGGLVGGLRAVNDGLYTSSNTGPTTIERCCNRVNVTGRYAVGGIVGSAATSLPTTGLPDALMSDYYVNIIECANEGDIAAAYAGEFSRRGSTAGGIVGSGQMVGLTACYNAGRVQAGYCAGGVMGRGNYTGIFSCYSSGQAMQYASGSGYANMTGLLVGASAKTNAYDCYALERSDNYVNELVGMGDSVSVFKECGVLDYDAMYRTDDFLAKVNTDSLHSTTRSSYVIGRDFPLLAWQVTEGALLAPMPHFTVQPQGVLPVDAYRQGDAAEALVAEVAAVSEGELSWQWYACDSADGGNAESIAGATGKGSRAMYVPSTEAVGARFYRVEFTNTVNHELAEEDSAVALSDVAAVFVRTRDDAERPRIIALNPSLTSDFNTSLTVNQASDLELEVRAEVSDGGTLSYQWFQAPSMDDSAAAPVGSGGRTLKVDTATEGRYYYYVKVVNDVGFGNSKDVKSDWVTVTVQAAKVSSYEELAAFRDAVNSGTSYSGLTITLTDDIEIPEGVNWVPIGTRSHPFAGTFQGSSARPGTVNDQIEMHEIRGLSVQGDELGNEYLGLFGYTYGASIYNVQVQGEVKGAANRYAGLLVGYAYGATSDAVIGNCAALPDSSVEGKYLIGGLVGYSGDYLENCANHAAVTGRAYSYDSSADSDSSTLDLKGVGGIAGRVGGAIVAWSYNDGAIAVDPIEGGANRCASAVGGVVGYADSSSALVSCYNAGEIAVGDKAENIVEEPHKVRYAGSVAGYLVASANLHYLEGTYDRGTEGGSGQEQADMHSWRFMDTSYFAGMMNTGYASYPSSQFVKSKGAAPHLAWEHDLSSARGTVLSAEPWIADLQWADVSDVTSTWRGALYQGYEPDPIYTLVDSPDGGALTVTWQVREPGKGDGDWRAAEGGTVTLSAEESVEGKVGFTFPVDTPGTFEYRVIAVNKRADADVDDVPEDDRTTVAPPITVTVKSSDGLLSKPDPTQPSSADNPWLVKSAEQLKFLADVVGGSESSFPGVGSSTFKGEYVMLANDIDLSSYGNWQPIGYDDAGYHTHDFQGVFDGGNHVVSGLSISSEKDGLAARDFLGLFGAVNGATVKNLAVEGSIDVDGSGAWAIGGVAGYALGGSFSNVVNRVDVTAYNSFGGIVGYAGGTTFENCENAGTVTVNEASRAAAYGQRGIGGIVGRSFDTRSVRISNCFNSGCVTARSGADSEYYFGAVLGSGTGTLANCYYQVGSVVDLDGGPYDPTGRGGSAAGPTADGAGKVMPVEANGDADVAGGAAWKLNTGAGAELTSRLWGAFAQDAGTAVQVHLVLGDASRVVYHVNPMSEAADIQVSPEYAVTGQEIAIGWQGKPGFEVGSVSWKAVGASEGTTNKIGEGNATAEDLSFIMPSDDVMFVLEYEHDTSYRYKLASNLTYQGKDAVTSVGTIQLMTREPGRAYHGEDVAVTIAVAKGYEVRTVSAFGFFGTPVDVERIDGLHYRFTMPAESITVTVDVDDVGAQADEKAESLEVTSGALHYRHSDATYADANLLYNTVAFSGSYFGSEEYLMTAELEQLGRSSSSRYLGLYEQRYTFADGSTHRYTGHDLAVLVKRLNGYADIAGDTPVIIETHDGALYEFSYGDIASRSYNAYADATVQPTTRGLPVLLYYGCDGAPNTQGAVGVVFGQEGADDDNVARLIEDVTRISVGDDVNYSQHVWGGYANMDAISGGKANATNGYTDLHVRVYRGADSSGALVSEDVLSLTDIETLARADRAGIQRGTYSTVLYESREEASDGPYTDYYEGYDLMTLLERMGVYYVDAESAARTKVQFYQTGMYGLDRSFKTVNVSLSYLAGNGSGGKGDYSNNRMTYVIGSDGSTPPGTGTLTGLRPMLVYGKNGLPLVWSSGQASPYAYNYRGPMMAFLPQNAVEGGEHVGGQTATACYLALIDVYVPDDIDYPDRASEQSKAVLSSAADAASAATKGVTASKDGTDINAGVKWAPQSAFDVLATAIERARSTASKASASVDEVSNATAQLSKAVSAFEAAVQTHPALSAGKWARSKDGKKFYGDSKGKLAKGFVTIAGASYFFDRSTGALVTGFFTDNAKRYYANASGVVQSGKFAVGSNSYYANASRVLQVGWIHVGSTWYYANSSSVLFKGKQTIGGKKYYFDPATCVAKTGRYKVGTASYYGGTKGLISTGLFKVGSATYLANANGVLQSGLKKSSGKAYYFAAGTFAAKTGLFKAGSVYYHANKSGVLQKGMQTISGKKHYFDTGTYKAKSGKFKVGSKHYWAAAKGQLKIGKFKVGSASYYADKSGVLKKGFVKAGKVTYYANSTYVLQKGWKKIKGKYYYFDKKTYQMAKGKWIGSYYVNKSGVRTKTKAKSAVKTKSTGLVAASV